MEPPYGPPIRGPLPDVADHVLQAERTGGELVDGVRRRVAVLGAGLHAPDDAVRLGLVNRTAADPVTAARSVLAALAKHPPAAYAATKNDLREGSMDTTPAEREAFIDDVVPFWTSPELKAMIRKLLGG